MRYFFILFAIFLAGSGSAQVLRFPAGNPPPAVILLGEVHDNPRQHEMQARVVAEIRPAALVFEMLTPVQADLITDDNRQDPAGLQAVLAWDESGWPDFSLYYPIIAAVPKARIFGAGLPRAAARRAFKTGIVRDFGDAAARFGLDVPLSEAEQSEREAFQREVHCNALPETLLAGMVELQRLRDAYLARAVVAALEIVGGPVVVITGNGHARKDRGLAVYLRQAAPNVTIFAVGMSEDGQIDGVFDQVLDFAAEPRADPCLAFGKSD